MNAISQYQNYLSIKTTEIAEVFNYYFSNEVPDLGLKTPDALILHSLKNEDPIVNAASEYQILYCQNLKHCKNQFSFKVAILDDVVNVSKRLAICKASHVSDRHTLKNLELFSPFLLTFMNMSLNSTIFPSFIKLADVTPVFPLPKNQLSICQCPAQPIKNI